MCMCLAFFVCLFLCSVKAARLSVPIISGNSALSTHSRPAENMILK